METRQTYLDGLRGWAAVIVLFYHVFSNGFPPSAWAETDLKLWLPFNGFFAVSAFFVVSGFALSTGFVRSGDRADLIRKGAGRYVRLFVPVAAICLIVHVTLLLGLVMPVDERPTAFRSFLAFEPTLEHLFRFTTYEVFFDYRPDRSYVAPLWTMSIELVGSFGVLALLAAVGRSSWRWLAYAVAGAGLLAINTLYFLFLAGVILAELAPARNAASRTGQGTAWLAIAQGLIVPFVTPWEVSPALLISTSVFCWGLIAAAPIRRLLSSGVSARCGRLSFPIYLVHGPVMFVIGLPLLVAAEGSPAAIALVGVVVCAVSLLLAVPFIFVDEGATRWSRAIGRFAAPRRPVFQA
ncbi:acyltransferase family protein [Bosea sp. TAF32]|uniref:acyltransferase family protein n=1 Tax=Bosea sp. TAF32 TaxID=3237482 RepID=UPI003F8E2A37